ncbi:hypothetical protein AB0D57_02155 [Streptomyces sp. NPDC048275]
MEAGVLTGGEGITPECRDDGALTKAPRAPGPTLTVVPEETR